MYRSYPSFDIDLVLAFVTNIFFIAFGDCRWAAKRWTGVTSALAKRYIVAFPTAYARPTIMYTAVHYHQLFRR
eukprot:scaffold4460_cov67-Cylindrotheca_fusiformis.AAC.3